MICVDWAAGAVDPNYVRAAVNTRLVGKQVIITDSDRVIIFITDSDRVIYSLQTVRARYIHYRQ